MRGSSVRAKSSLMIVGARMQQGCDARGDRIELDAGDMAAVAQVLRHQRRKQARADAGLEHPSATKAEPRHAGPDRADDVFGREMGVLGAAGERGVDPASTADSSAPPISSQPLRKASSPGRLKTPLASSDAPKPVKRMSCACSSAVAGR